MRPTQENIKDNKCPVCGTYPVEYKIWSQHTNKEWNESVKFACGCVLHYSPNYGEVLVNISCPRAHEFMIKLKQHVQTLTGKEV